MSTKKSMVRKTLVVCSTLAVLAPIVGCNSGGGGSQTQKIVVWYPDPAQKPIMAKIVKNFEASHPNIQVEADLQSFTNYFQQLQTTLAANNGPDLFRMNMPNFLNYVNKGYIMPLSVNLNWSNYPKMLVNTYSVNGTHYGVPKDYDTVGLFYNKALFDAAHIPYPTDNWTWSDLRAAAKKLTIPGKQWGFNSYISGQTVQYDFMLQAGANLLSPDKKSTDLGSPQAIKAVQFLYDLMYVDKSSPDGHWQTNNDPDQTFQTGKIAMLTEGDWMAPQFYASLKNNLGVAALPHDVRQGNIIHGTAWVVNAHTKAKDAAMKFAEYMGSKDVALLQAQEVLPAYNGTQTQWIKSLPTINAKVFVDSVNWATSYPSTSNPNWENPFNSEMTNIWLQKETPAAGMAKVQQQADQILAGK